MKAIFRSLSIGSLLTLGFIVGCSPESNDANAGGTDPNKVVVPPGTPTGKASQGDMEAYMKKNMANSGVGAGSDYAKSKGQTAPEDKKEEPK